VSDNEKVLKKTCEICEGSGQVCSFKGVSRFALSWEDCPICGGMGFTTQETDAEKTILEQEKEKNNEA
jgi:hypothetical protein